MKRAQTQQIFIFVLIMIVVSLTLVFGYKYIKGFSEQGEQLTVILFQKELEKKINAVSQNYGEVDITELDLERKYDVVCFIDFSYYEEDAEALNSGYPLIDSSVNSGVEDNVFVGKNAAQSFKVSSLEIEDGFLCINNTFGKIKLRIEGLGNKAKIYALD